MRKKIVEFFLVLGTLLLGSGAYVADYFWVENYKDVPFYFQHIFEHNLKDFIIVDHIVSGLLTFLLVIPLTILFVLILLEDAFDRK